MEKIVKDKKFDKDLKNAEKLNKFLKILKKILIIILILLILYLSRKTIIVYSIMNKYKPTLNSNNYHIQVSSRQEDSIFLTETYYKDGISVSTHSSYPINSFSTTPKYIQHYNSNTGEITTFENSDYYGKIKYTSNDTDDVVLFSSMCNQIPFIVPPALFFNNATDMTTFDFITYFARHCIFSKIENTKLQGIDCYKITYGATFYIDKETGNLLRFHDGVDFNYYYEFGKVTDEDVKMPELEDYILHEFKN